QSLPSSSTYRQPMVPNALPMSHTPLPLPPPRTNRSNNGWICSGRASVVRSRSLPSRPSSASRTEPPTRCSSWPASTNRVDRPSTTPAMRNISRTAWVWALVNPPWVGTTGKSNGRDRPHSPRIGRVSGRVGRQAVRVVLTTLLLAAATVLGGTVTGQPAPAHAADDPLVRVDLTELRPTVARPGDTITLAGTVTNTGSRPLHHVQVLMWRDQAPLTTEEQLDWVLQASPGDPPGAA